MDVATSAGGSTYAYYEGSWDKLPDFAKLKPKATGACGGLRPQRRPPGQQLCALKFEGYFKVDRDGNYRFSLDSDDGSKLYVDGRQVVDNDGIHPPKSVTGGVQLTKGIHKVVVAFFQAGGGAELERPGAGPGPRPAGLRRPGRGDRGRPRTSSPCQESR